MRLYNTLFRQKQVFVPLKTDPDGTPHVRMYNCGPTVYDYAHIGNFRSFVFADLLRRYFEYKGWRVTQVMNITDVGHMTDDEADDGMDKMEFALEKLAPELRDKIKTPYDLAKYYEEAFHEDRKLLRIQDAEHYPRATEHVDGMIEMVKTLLEKGHAYEVAGNVYFDVSSFPNYGTLSGNTIDKLRAGARVEVNPEKRHPADFALWKHDPSHLMKWDSPWGEGYPGWHLECSVMGEKYLGEEFDIHTGGEDNIFPHHECEIAQSNATFGKECVKFWLHTRHLQVDGKKMSKSLGNFYTIRDLVEKGYGPDEIRYELMSTNYQQHMNFTLEGLKAAKNRIYRFRRTLSLIKSFYFHSDNIQQSDIDIKVKEKIKNTESKFIQMMDNNLNVSGALGQVSNFVSYIRKLDVIEKLNKSSLKLAWDFFKRINHVLVFILPKEEELAYRLVDALLSEDKLIFKSLAKTITNDYDVIPMMKWNLMHEHEGRQDNELINILLTWVKKGNTEEFENKKHGFLLDRIPGTSSGDEFKELNEENMHAFAKFVLRVQDSDLQRALNEYKKFHENGLYFELVPKKIEKISDDVEELRIKRDEARKNKDWSEADRLRDELEGMGFEVKDTPEGTKLTRK